jgi:serine phosphatase RsbU (regulator of sigma subunit)
MILLWLRFPHYRGKQLEGQTELARQVQTDLLPAGGAAIENLDFAAACVPAWQVGGDFYDVFSAGDARIAIVLGDVSGKGLPAAVVAGVLLGAVRASSWTAGSGEHEASSRRLSELLRTRTSLERFASLFWCYYESESQLLRYVNAGHLPPDPGQAKCWGRDRHRASDGRRAGIGTAAKGRLPPRPGGGLPRRSPRFIF